MVWWCDSCGLEGEFSTKDESKCGWGGNLILHLILACPHVYYIRFRSRSEADYEHYYRTICRRDPNTMEPLYDPELRQWPLYGVRRCCNCALYEVFKTVKCYS